MWPFTRAASPSVPAPTAADELRKSANAVADFIVAHWENLNCPKCGCGSRGVDPARTWMAPLWTIRCPRCGFVELIHPHNAFRRARIRPAEPDNHNEGGG